MTRTDQAGNTYYDASDAMKRLNIKARATLQSLVKHHNLKRYGFFRDKRVYYRAEDIEYLATEETEDVYELPPLEPVAAAS